MRSGAFIRLARRVNVVAVALCIGLQISIRASIRIWAAVHGVPEPLLAQAVTALVFTVTAFGAAFVLNLGVAAEYRSSPLMFAGWICLAANCGVSVIRSILESRSLSWIWPNYLEGPLYEVLHQTPIALANIFLLAGLISMWAAFRSMALREKLSKGDWTSIGLILSLLLGILMFRHNLEGGRSPYGIALLSEKIGLVILSFCAAISVVLHRLAVDMGGGHLARALRFLAAYATLRSLLVFAAVFLNPGPDATVLRLAIDTGWAVVPWLATLGAISAAGLAVEAANTLAARRAARVAPALHF